MPTALRTADPAPVSPRDATAADPLVAPAVPSAEARGRPKGPLAGSVWGTACRRFAVLAALLSLQSGSQVLMQRYEELIKTRIVIVLFFGMVVGAGGNAGNQAAVAVITAMLAARERERVEGESYTERAASPEAAHGSVTTCPLGNAAQPPAPFSEMYLDGLGRRIRVRTNLAVSPRSTISRAFGIATYMMRLPFRWLSGLRRVLKARQQCQTQRRRRVTLSLVRVLRGELLIGLCCSFILMLTAGVRVGVFFYFWDDAKRPGKNLNVEQTHFYEEATIVVTLSLALFCVVMSSVVIGATLPFVLDYWNLDIEHAAPMVQVIMDLLGTWVCCVFCHALLPPLAP